MPDEYEYKPFGIDTYYSVLPTNQARTAGLFDWEPPKPKYGVAPELEHLLDPGTKEGVARAIQSWNRPVRDMLRSETGLKLTEGRRSLSVPVRIVDGLPAPFANIVDKLPDPLVWWVALNRPRFKAGANILQEVNLRYGELQESPIFRDSPGIPFSLLGRSAEYLQHLISKIDEQELDKAIRDIRTDVLGAYFFHWPKIEIYWVVIGVFSKLMSVDPEDLTVVVLAHELGHAYTHLGFDIDGRTWNTGQFSEADSAVVEGLAQYYTERVCRRLAERRPGAIVAYEELLAAQGGPYRAHLDWIDLGERTAEAVRQAMLDCRVNNVRRYEDFLEILRAAYGVIGIGR